ncbi:MAG: hypothetical protein COW00_03440 [Bdellovibrio sp. CG12_big_fil_rev_8_21_14_0_65_39_13]|nr:MAG: hypothetical protein COW78_10845 [Bdellovibrio sp. CG22_combo_CG10-13_8_21_14_all_39_27]PIQ61631.1 MAG: hypothetical protein COW00_03440 [Bdellovibrio sp. CG12_big_fil_rev_8_21_14_0_65_39_13]PIR35694.1 MAG: hypothetical protein COV37_07235 [Bdellovibrio sp. CG11_big_fil_rev_8_21_14_0_20_39_38]
MLPNEAREAALQHLFNDPEGFAQWLILKPEIQSWLSTLGANHLDKNLLLQSLIHSSFTNEISFNCQHSERLEFLGDAVLDLIITEVIFKLYPELSEGELSKLRASLVNSERLNELALANDWERVLLTGKTFDQKALKAHPTLLSDALEAFLGACSLSLGPDQTREIFSRIVANWEKKSEKSFYANSSVDIDPKGKLQEWVVKQFGEYPTYFSKDLGNGQYEVSLMVKDIILDSSTGDSKKKCERALALKFYKQKELLFDLLKERLC